MAATQSASGRASSSSREFGPLATAFVIGAVVAAAVQARTSPTTPPAAAPLNHLFSSPVAIERLDGDLRPAIDEVARILVRKFNETAGTHARVKLTLGGPAGAEAAPDYRRERSANEVFFAAQQDASTEWYRERDACVERAGSSVPSFTRYAECGRAADASNAFAELRSAPAFRALQAALRQALRVFATASGAETRLADPDPFFWASVHLPGKTWHTPHTHVRSIASGVLYLASPPGSGRLVFADPRRDATQLGAYADLEAMRTRTGATAANPQGDSIDPAAFTSGLAVSPEPGLLAIFPGFLSHYVEPSVALPGGGGGPRVSLSFNWIHDDGWSVLARASRYATPPEAAGAGGGTPAGRLEEVETGGMCAINALGGECEANPSFMLSVCAAECAVHHAEFRDRIGRMRPHG
jgi:hypothetical protein